MKYIYVFLLSFFLIGCGELSDDEKDSNLDNGGEGSKEEPYVVGSGIYTLVKNLDKTYFTFDIKNSDDDCSMLLYDVYSNEGNFTLSSNDATFNPNVSQYIAFYQISNMSNGTYVLTNDSDVDSKFGLYSTCVSLDNSALVVLKDNFQTDSIETDYQLFTFTLDTKKSIKLTFSGLGSYSGYLRVLFDSDFQRIYSFDDLEAGTYYLLLEGSINYPPKVKFELL